MKEIPPEKGEYVEHPEERSAAQPPPPGVSASKRIQPTYPSRAGSPKKEETMTQNPLEKGAGLRSTGGFYYGQRRGPGF